MSTTDQRETEVQNRELAIMVGLLVAGIILMYLGRATILHYGSKLTAGLFGISVLIGGGDPAFLSESIRPAPSMTEFLLCAAGGIAITLNAVFIHTGGSRD